MNITDLELVQIINTVQSVSAYDFSEYSEKSLKRRFLKILLDYRITVPELLDQLKNHPRFVEEVTKKVTVNTTEMFRDPAIWHIIRAEIISKLAHKTPVRIWHAGCSTGQEVYSMTIMLNEMGLLDKTEIYATDLNTDAIDIARKGVYKYKFNLNYLDNFDKVIRTDGQDVKDAPCQKYFEIDHVNDKIRLNKFLLEKPVFAKHDLVKDANIFHTPFDLILCRNVIIYFNYSLQNKIFSLFYDSLVEDGFLVLGIHESIAGPFSVKFEKREHFYKKR
jgi:chemotaxis protein methyltransferase CheR